MIESCHYKYRKTTCPTAFQYVMEPPPAARSNHNTQTYLRARETVTFGIWRNPEAVFGL